MDGRISFSLCFFFKVSLNKIGLTVIFWSRAKVVGVSLSWRTPNLADIQGWIVAETEGCKVAYITLERVQNLPTHSF